MITYLIRDGNDYLKWFANNCAYFTQTHDEALAFHRLAEAEIVARALSPLASSGFNVQVRPMDSYRERAGLDRRFFP